MLTFRQRRQQQQSSIGTITTTAATSNLVSSSAQTSLNSATNSKVPIFPANSPIPQTKRKSHLACFNRSKNHENPLLSRRLRNIRGNETSVVNDGVPFSNLSFKRPVSFKRKRVNTSYSRVKRVHHGKDSDFNLDFESENENNSPDDDDLTTDSVHSDYAESNEDKEASGDDLKSSNR